MSIAAQAYPSEDPIAPAAPSQDLAGGSGSELALDGGEGEAGMDPGDKKPTNKRTPALICHEGNLICLACFCTYFDV